MDRNEKIVLIASSAIVVGSSAVFAISAHRKAKGFAELMKKVDELKNILATPSS